MLRETMDKLYGAWWGAFLGDAIATPTHGYSSSKLLHADYGEIKDMVAPKDIHPESILYTLPRPEYPPEFDYLGARRREIWQHRGAHPHIGFQAGENTLPLFLALHLAASLDDSGEFNIDSWMTRYQAVMTTADMHSDTFIPSIHRRYFENLAQGRRPEKNGCPDAHMSDLAIFIPLMLGALKNPDKTQMNLYRALEKFATGESASNTAFFLAKLLALIIRGDSIEEAMYKKMTPDSHFSLAFPYRRWIKNDDDQQAISSTGILAQLEESVPLTLYLTLKYNKDIKKALFTNANLGGETTGRGAIIGMLIGAQNGFSKIDASLIGRLRFAPEIQALGNLMHKKVA